MATVLNKYDNRAAGDIVPPLPKINSLQALTRLRPKRGSEWCTFAFVLNRDMIKPDGSLDDLHAVVFPLGSFDDQARAEEHAKNVISITGHPGVITSKYGAAVPLTLRFDPNVVSDVPVDMKGRLIEMESAQYKREREEYERHVKQERDIMKEAEEETDPDSIEHFKRQCYLAIKNRANYQFHSREADAAWENYKKREMAVRDHYAHYPEHEKQLLPYLKEKLIERGELNLYHSLEAAYKEIRDELLGLVDSDNDDDDNVVSINTLTTLTNEVSSNLPTTLTNEVSSNLSTTLTNEVSKQNSKTEDVRRKVVDNIECECPGVCLGLQQSLQSNKGNLSDDCPDGICLATSVSKSEENGVCGFKKPTESTVESPEEDIISPEAITVTTITTEVVIKSEKETISTDDDDLISADAVAAVTGIVTHDQHNQQDPGFVDEPPEDESPTITAESVVNTKSNNKRKSH